MLSLFFSLTERLKALFVTNLAREFESDFLTADAERQAQLHRLAARYEREGLASVAKQLRQRVDALDSQQPLALILPATDHLLGHPIEFAPVLVSGDSSSFPDVSRRSQPTPKKKGR